MATAGYVRDEWRGGDMGNFDDVDDRLSDLERRVDETGNGRGGLSLAYGMGMALAMILSWSRNSSILWCMLHGLFSWLYVAYFTLTR